jgi:hypothetical protein
VSASAVSEPVPLALAVPEPAAQEPVVPDTSVVFDKPTAAACTALAVPKEKTNRNKQINRQKIDRSGIYQWKNNAETLFSAKLMGGNYWVTDIQIGGEYKIIPFL